MDARQEVCWDGDAIHFLDHDAAIAAQAAGKVQIFDGAGYQPGYQMKYAWEFPFSTSGPADPPDPPAPADPEDPPQDDCGKKSKKQNK